jgi:HAD superfamily hydrolase (TIGR01549 family)
MLKDNRYVPAFKTKKYIFVRETLKSKTRKTRNGAYSIMVIEAVIFDLDGTLATFNLDYKTLRVEVRNYLRTRGVPASVLSPKESMFEMLEKAEVFFRNAAKNDQVFDEIKKETSAIAEKFEIEAAASTSLMPGAYDALKTLKQMKVRIGLCTINSQKATKNILQRFQIADFFNAVVPRDSVKRVKPNPEHFEAALKALQANPKTTLVIGDSIVDMQSAKDIKAIAVGIPTGTAKMEQLTSSGANYIITAISDLPILIQKINKEEEN